MSDHPAKIEPTTLTVPEAAALLGMKNTTTIRDRVRKGRYKHYEALRPQGTVYLIDREDFYRQHPAAARDNRNNDGDYLTRIQAETTALLEVQHHADGLAPTRQAIEALSQALAEVVAGQVQPLIGAARVAHEDAQMAREALTQMQQQQAVIYQRVEQMARDQQRERQGRGILRRLLGL